MWRSGDSPLALEPGLSTWRRWPLSGGCALVGLPGPNGCAVEVKLGMSPKLDELGVNPMENPKSDP